MISYEALEFLTGYARATLSKAIRMLEEKKWIQIVKIGNANAYLINSGAFWQSYGNRKYTSFHAQIVAIDKEQTKPVEEMAKSKITAFSNCRSGRKGFTNWGKKNPLLMRRLTWNDYFA